MSAPRPHPEDAAIKQTAATWLARQDRGLTASEQDDYLQWLRQNPQHGEALVHLRATWTALDALHHWRPAHGTQPNPDLLARRPRARRQWRRFASLSLVAAAITLGLFFGRTARTPEKVSSGVHVIPRPEQIALADGSIVELNQDGKIETEFTPEFRRVRLVRGEAHFTVSKNPARPFIVEAGAVSVRAVGTAFEVRRGAAAVEVLVTEGKVHVEQSAASSAPTPLVAGEHALVDTTPRAAPPIITSLTPAEIERAMAWQGVRLEFDGLPLAEVVAEFNLRNAAQIVIADSATAKLRVGGSFAATNVESFIRLLQASFSVTADRRADGTVVLHLAK